MLSFAISLGNVKFETIVTDAGRLVVTMCRTCSGIEVAIVTVRPEVADNLAVLAGLCSFSIAAVLTAAPALKQTYDEGAESDVKPGHPAELAGAAPRHNESQAACRYGWIIANKP